MKHWRLFCILSVLLVILHILTYPSCIAANSDNSSRNPLKVPVSSYPTSRPGGRRMKHRGGRGRLGTRGPARICSNMHKCAYLSHIPSTTSPTWLLCRRGIAGIESMPAKPACSAHSGNSLPRRSRFCTVLQESSEMDRFGVSNLGVRKDA